MQGCVEAIWRGRNRRAPGCQGWPAEPSRSLEVLRLLVQGETIKGISEKLGLSEKTVANQQWAIRAKLGAGNSAQVALLAAKMGLVR